MTEYVVDEEGGLWPAEYATNRSWRRDAVARKKTMGVVSYLEIFADELSRLSMEDLWKR